MLSLNQVVGTFPSVRLPSASGGLPVEVSLIAQLGHGSGNHLFAGVASRLRRHAAFVDALEEPSARLGATDFAKGDATALYSFVVGPHGHPFHRHAGHRIFTAVSGSGGAQLRFSSASPRQIAEDPENFVRALRYINIPPDCLFTVRFGGETWHQFSPLARNTLHPAFFALSCHTNELGGALSDELRNKVLANDADIPSLTEVLPPRSRRCCAREDFRAREIPTTSLSLDAPEGTFHRVVCNSFRGGAGVLRGAWGACKDASGYLSHSGRGGVAQLAAPPEDSLLRGQLEGLPVHHEDTFLLSVPGAGRSPGSAAELLADVLEGFLLNAPPGVTSLMALRNALVKPLGLRTSPLGCPVSSLLSPRTDNLFARRYPVLDQRVDASSAQVVLGADDKHLKFRSCVGIRVSANGDIGVTLGTRVRCLNAFGRFYMAIVDPVHRRYITPAMLRLAVDYALAKPGGSA